MELDVWTAKLLHALQNLCSKGEDKIQLRRGHESPEGEWVYSSTLSLISALDGVSGQRHGSVAFPPGTIRYPLVFEAGWAPAPVWTGAEYLDPTWIRSPDRPTRSESLHRLSTNF